MRLFVKLMVIVLIAALAGPFFIKGPDGRPLMTTDDVTASIASSKASLARQWQRLTTGAARAAGNDNAGKTRVYRWQDADGQWHYSDEPGPDGQSEMMYVDPDVNRLAPPPPAPPAPSPASDRTTDNSDRPDIPIPLILNPGAVKGVIDETQAARDQVNERNAEIKRRIDEQ